MEYIDGEDLKTLLHRIGRLPNDKGIEIAQQLCAGLAAAHSAGVLHRDLKPANVMIDGNGRARITDFGLASQSTDGKNDIVGMSGTPAYMAPEQFLRGETSIQSDLYSLGVLLFEVFSGDKLHQVATVAELRNLHEANGGSTVPNLGGRDVDATVLSAIRRCLDSEPHARPTTANQLAASLPGGDPLGVALAAGETPSPELLAASGGDGVLPPGRATAILFGYFVLLGIAVFLINLGSIPRKLGTEALKPEVLRHESQKILRSFGHSELSFFDCGFFDQSSRLNTAKNELGQQEFQRIWALEERPFDGLEFWCRSSPDRLVNTELQVFIENDSFGVDLESPGWNVPGMTGLKLSPSGRLRWYRAVPRAGTSHSEDKSEIDWYSSFPQSLTGFDLKALKPASWARMPPDAFDEYMAWEGTWPSTGVPLRVHAAAVHGQPIFFEVISPWPAGESERVEPMMAWVYFFVDVFVFALGYWNYRNGRGDRRAANGLAIYVCCMSIISTILLATLDPPPYIMHILILIFVRSAGVAAFIWIQYMAIEPHMRKHWPEALLSWSRVFHGVRLSPRIGRDVLYGATAAVVVTVLKEATLRVLGDVSDTPVGFLFGAKNTIGYAIASHLASNFMTVTGLVALIVGLHIVTRSKWLSILHPSFDFHPWNGGISHARRSIWDDRFRGPNCDPFEIRTVLRARLRLTRAFVQHDNLSRSH